MILDFDASLPNNSRFFSAGDIHFHPGTAKRFVENATACSDEDLAVMADEISRLVPENIKRLSVNITPAMRTEQQLAMVFHNPRVLAKMDDECVTDAFKILYEKKFTCVIKKVFFEESLEMLAIHRPGSMSLLGGIMGGHRRLGDAAEWMKGQGVDIAFSKELIVHADAGKDLTTGQWDFIRSFQLPETLRAFLKARAASEHQYKIVSDIQFLVRHDLLSPKYLSVVKDVVGDDFLIKCVRSSAPQELGFKSVAKLSKIYGESAFHDDDFFRSLHWGPNSPTPKYITLFVEDALDEEAFPLLSAYVVSKLDQLITRQKISRIPDKELMVDVMKLAGRIGQGEKALHAFAQCVRALAGDVRQPSRIFEGLRTASLPYKPEAGGYHEASHRLQLDAGEAYDAFTRTAGALGLEILKKVAPDLGGRVVVDVMTRSDTQLSTREIIRMFPQAKGGLLENDLGM